MWVGGQKRLHFGNPRLQFAYLLCNFNGSTTKVIKVVCENNARPSVKRRMSLCVYAKSRDVLKVPSMSYCSRSRRRRFTALYFKIEHIVAFTAIFSNICTAHGRSGNIWTSGVNLDTAVRSVDPDFLLECKILAIWRRLPLIFAF